VAEAGREREKRRNARSCRGFRVLAIARGEATESGNPNSIESKQ
jgi:hypothetical protein